tara:strand:+ start:569 stop:952 length:384 start_codon:yes stop_codon:yes gene_type:complete
MRLGVQYPIHAGSSLASYNATVINDTDWHNLTSSDFYDTITGSQFSAGLKFAFIMFVSSNSSTLSMIKLRAAGSATDGITNTDGVIPVFSSFSVDSQALSAGSSVTTISYKKANGADSFVIYAGFNV